MNHEWSRPVCESKSHQDAENGTRDCGNLSRTSSMWTAHAATFLSLEMSHASELSGVEFTVVSFMVEPLRSAKPNRRSLTTL